MTTEWPPPVAYSPCFTCRRWLRGVLSRMPNQYDGWAEYRCGEHICRGVSVGIWTFRYEHGIPMGDPGRAFGSEFCTRCALPIPEEMVGQRIFQKCCSTKALTVCRVCALRPAPEGHRDYASFWYAFTHKGGRCARRCQSCGVMPGTAPWRCRGWGVAGSKCEPTLCAKCFDKHRRSCLAEVIQRVFACPHCNGRVFKMEGDIAICSWCKATWEHVYSPGADMTITPPRVKCPWCGPAECTCATQFVAMT